MSGETFEALLAPNLGSIRRFVQSKTRMPEHAEDIVQQTLLHAFAHRHQLRVHAKFRSWLASIAMNEIRGIARRTRNFLPLEAIPPPASIDPTASPYLEYERMERVERLHQGLARLTDRDRLAIHLVDFAEAKLSEAAKSMAISNSALKSTHFRARNRLRAAMHNTSRPRRPAGR